MTGDERTQLVGWLDLQRALIPWKCEGLSEEDAHRSVLPPSPMMTMAGLVSHLRWVEHTWFEVLMQNAPTDDNPLFGDVDDADMMVADVPIARLIDDYAAQCARSNEIVAAHSLDDLAQNSELFRSGAANLRWMMIHMVEETARHVGHADAIRELLDGTKGYY
jgi:hypothetical protein